MAFITMTVSDGTNVVKRSIQVFVNFVNDAPVITSISNQVVVQGHATDPLEFMVADAETSGDGLTVWGESSDPALVPTNYIVLAGSGNQRTVTLTALDEGWPPLRCGPATARTKRPAVFRST
jgi:hypothetical protein